MTTVIVIIVVLVIAAALAAAFMASQKRQRAALQDRFGPEYDRAVDESGSQREAERHLAKVAHRRDKLEIRDLDAAERGRFTDEWDVVQSRFVDEPAAAVDSAETLIGTVMRERGYPVEDFEEQAELVSADHPDVVSEYRAAHEAHERHRGSGGVDTEDLRQAFVHYRTLFVTLVDPESAPADRPVVADSTTADSTSADATSADATTTGSTTADATTADAVTTGAPVVAEPARAEVPADEPVARPAEGTPIDDTTTDDTYHAQETR